MRHSRPFGLIAVEILPRLFARAAMFVAHLLNASREE